MSTQPRVSTERKRRDTNPAPHRRSFLRSKLLPVLRLVLVVAIVAIIGHAIVVKVARPFVLYRKEKQETQRLSEKVEQLQEENRLLEERIKYIKSDKGLNSAARRLGYVKPGEVTIVLPEEAPKNK